ncbi:hypothetical protein [[Kitasatospora] papulosa]|uniref:hypothetical protein n=1 Tax=[Kitasatospora] papulosa TaxID=1464011 RepID=UPI00386E0A10
MKESFTELEEHRYSSQEHGTVHGFGCGLADFPLMESEVIAALIATPTVLVAATAAWAAGRAQGRGAYHGPVDAVRRATQREAYADLHRSARHFIDAWETAEAEANDPGSGYPQAEMNAMRAAMGVLEHAHETVLLEGPEPLAQIAERIWAAAKTLGGTRLPAMFGGGHTWPFNDDRPEALAERNEAVGQFRESTQALLVEARRYLNGGHAK